MVLLPQEGKEIDAISAVSIGHVVCYEVVVGVGEVNPIPALSHYAVKAGVISRNGIAVGKEQGQCLAECSRSRCCLRYCSLKRCSA